MRDVHKSFRQRQRPQDVASSLRSLFRPEFRTIQALRGVNLDIQRGEVVAYAGPNGAGKSTTIRLIAGLSVPDSGSVRALGVDPARKRINYMRRIAVVFGQRTELWWDHSVGASFEWKRATWGIEDAAYRTMVGRLKDQFDLEPMWRTLARELSLGQRMRADLALALLHDPELILLDEPTLGLDVVVRDRMLEWIRHLNRDAGKTVFITSHSMQDLERLDARVVIVHQGSLRFDGSFDQLRTTVTDRRRLVVRSSYEQAPNLEGARLIESINGVHTYDFVAAETSAVSLLSQLTEQEHIHDISTSPASIDEVIGDVYRNLVDDPGAR
ncbi:ATP-binding cassette domain-containing protein [uncultured Microbacterium sp.]|uniref:ABC transporter ATP-binding protein n=1 Tax=uncultured Microbacterium sp. TaxID=191216 RepID=UPI0035C9871C